MGRPLSALSNRPWLLHPTHLCPPRREGAEALPPASSTALRFPKASSRSMSKAGGVCALLPLLSPPVAVYLSDPHRPSAREIGSYVLILILEEETKLNSRQFEFE